MAVTVQVNSNESVSLAPHHYIGLSSDTKPTVASSGGLPTPTALSTFYAYDTGLTYITCDGTNWAEKKSESSVVEDAIKAVTDAEETLTETGGTVTTDGTEQNVYIADAPSGLFIPVCVKIDCTNHTAGETIVVRTYYRIKTGGDYILQTATTHAAAIVPALLNIDLEPNRFGVKVTIEKTAGTNRAYDWEAVYGV